MKIGIIGSGLAGCTLADELRKQQPDAELWLFSQEAHGLYSRPLLSHGFSRADIQNRIVMKNLEALRETLKLEVRAPVSVVRLDPEKMALTLSSGESVEGFDKLVLATGSEAFVPPKLAPFRKDFLLLNSLDDLELLLKIRARKSPPRWIVIGGGLIGCEVSSDLIQAGDKVVLIHLMDRLMERQLTPDQSAKLFTHLTTAGVDVKLERDVIDIHAEGEEKVVRCQDGEAVKGDFVLVAVGFRPRIDLAREAGLTVQRGIVTDGFLQTTHPDIYAVGDVAEISGNAPYAFVSPVRNQALWLAKHLTQAQPEPWKVPAFRVIAKVHGFKLD